MQGPVGTLLAQARVLGRPFVFLTPPAPPVPPADLPGQELGCWKRAHIIRKLWKCWDTDRELPASHRAKP